MTLGIAGDKRYEKAAAVELQAWLGVEYSFAKASKHACLTVRFNGKSKKLFYPATGGDRKGSLNHRQDIRGVMRELGAVKAVRPKTETTVVRTKRPRRVKVVAPDTTPIVREDKWTARLAIIKIEPPKPPLTFWQFLKAYLWPR